MSAEIFLACFLACLLAFTTAFVVGYQVVVYIARKAVKQFGRDAVGNAVAQVAAIIELSKQATIEHLSASGEPAEHHVRVTAICDRCSKTQGASFTVSQSANHSQVEEIVDEHFGKAGWIKEPTAEGGNRHLCRQCSERKAS